MINGKSLLDYIHPIGTYYIADDGEHPAEKFYKLCGFGGTWEKKQGVFLLSSSDKYALGSEGGSADAVVVAHNHPIIQYQDNYSWYVYVGKSGSGRYGVPLTYTAQKISEHDQDLCIARNAGEDGTGKNMPPYLVVDVYKRVEDPVE